jgi:uncharacterized damage-inducible protein DinB
MSTALRNPHLAQWDAQLAASAAYAHAATRTLPDGVLVQRPSWGGWSVAEVFEHLCVTDSLYEAPLRALIDAERTRALMRDADSLDLRAMKLSSPAARHLRLNAGDAFAVNVVHAERHMGQVRRTLADVTDRRPE